MRSNSIFRLLMPLMALAIGAQAQSNHTLVVTASNATQNQLLVYDAGGNLIQNLSTHGQGGVSGNAGGIEAHRNLVAVVNFGSKSVSLFERQYDGFHMMQTVSTNSSPVSVAFGPDHLYVLGTTTVASYQMYQNEVNSRPDGVTTLLHADGTAAQVGVLPGQLIVTEKSNVIETVNLSNGAVSGVPTPVGNIPANLNEPLGLVTRGNDAYVTIAKANEISLVRDGTILTNAIGTQNAPCWATLMGPFLYTGNTGSHTVSRYAVYGQEIVLDAAVVAQQNGSTTDISAAAGMAAVIDGSSGISHLSIYSVDEDGNFTLIKASTINGSANGVAVVPADRDDFNN